MTATTNDDDNDDKGKDKVTSVSNENETVLIWTLLPFLRLFQLMLLLHACSSPLNPLRFNRVA